MRIFLLLSSLLILAAPSYADSNSRVKTCIAAIIDKNADNGKWVNARAVRRNCACHEDSVANGLLNPYGCPGYRVAIIDFNKGTFIEQHGSLTEQQVDEYFD